MAHGTLSEYRKPEDALAASCSLGSSSIFLRDNFLELTTDAESAQAAVESSRPHLESFLQSLTVLYGQLFTASILSAEDDKGEPKQVHVTRRSQQLFRATVYNLGELKNKVETAAEWVSYGDDATRKSLFYAEHAALLRQFSETLPFESPHAAFSRALAFLQLFKALTALIGDPSSDKDYQSRFRRIGLPADFWTNRAKPLYNVRNDADVAHYSHEMPDASAFLDQYGAALGAFRDALAAHVQWKRHAGEG